VRPAGGARDGSVSLGATPQAFPNELPEGDRSGSVPYYMAPPAGAPMGTPGKRSGTALRAADPSRGLLQVSIAVYIAHATAIGANGTTHRASEGSPDGFLL